MYKTKVLPNYDEARRRRKTMKQKLYDDEGIGRRAQEAKRSSGISVQMCADTRTHTNTSTSTHARTQAQAHKHVTLHIKPISMPLYINI